MFASQHLQWNLTVCLMRKGSLYLLIISTDHTSFSFSWFQRLKKAKKMKWLTINKRWHAALVVTPHIKWSSRVSGQGKLIPKIFPHVSKPNFLTITKIAMPIIYSINKKNFFCPQYHCQWIQKWHFWQKILDLIS